jgi:conjugation system TraG family ATPase
MTTSVYPIHRAIGRPVTFKGFKGQYIWLAAAILIADFLFFILFYCGGLPTAVNIPLTFGIGITALLILQRLSRKYGRFGLMKQLAAKSLPPHLRYPSRQIFLQLSQYKKEQKLSARLPVMEIDNNFIISKNGDLSAAWEITNPELFTLSPAEQEAEAQTWVKVVESLPYGTILQKQDYYNKTAYQADFKNKPDSDFISHSNERHFHERPHREHHAYLIVTRKSSHHRPVTSATSSLLRRSLVPESILDPTQQQEFEEGCRQLEHIIKESKFTSIRRLTNDELAGTDDQPGLIERYTQLMPPSAAPGLSDIGLKDGISIGDKAVVIYSVSDADQLPAQISPYIPYDRYSTEKTVLSVGFAAALGPMLDTDHIYTQILIKDHPAPLLNELETRRRRLRSLSTTDRENAVAHDAIESYLTTAAADAKCPVKAHLNVIAWTDQPAELPAVKNKCASAMIGMGIVPHLETVGAPQIWWAGMPGNAADFPVNDTFYTFVEQFACFFILETNTPTSISHNGLRLGSRMEGFPLHVDISDVPLAKGYIDNLHKLIIGPSGSGKTFFMLGLVHSYYHQGAHIILLDIGDSYKRLCELLGGYYLVYSEEAPIQFNPFWLDKEDQLDIEKMENLIALLLVLCKKSDEPVLRSEYIVLSNMVSGFYRYLEKHNDIFPCFDSFYDYLIAVFTPRLVQDGVRDKHFDLENFLYVTRPYYKDGQYDYLLNAHDQLDILHHRLVIFELDAIKNHPILFPVITIVVMQLCISKMRRLAGARIAIILDEAWKPIATEGTNQFVKTGYKTFRKNNGEVIVVTQEIEDIISSPVVKNTIINNTGCRILLDQSSLMNRFEQLQELLGLSEKDKALVLSLNKANEPGKKYKEVFISLGTDHSRIYRVEASLEEYLIYTSKIQEKIKVNEYAQRHGSLQKGITALAADIRAGVIRLLLAFVFSAIFLLLPNGRASAQLFDLIDAAIKKALVTADLSVQRLQTQTLVWQNAQKSLENAMQDSWLSDITGWVQQQEELYTNYYQQLWQVKSVFATYSKVRQLVQRQTVLLQQYQQARAALQQDPHFSLDERRYIGNVYTNLLNETIRNTEQLALVMGNFLTQMDDASRLRVIDETAVNIDHNSSTLREFTQQTARLSAQRSKETRELESIKRLYGIQ